MAAPIVVDDGGGESPFEQELEILQEIYIHEMKISRNHGQPCELSLVLHPATADREDLQYVTLTLIFQISKEYPDVLPEILIKNPRGLSEGEISSLQKKLRECATSKLGEVMLYELIEVAKESLTANNTPSCECVICCYAFEDNEAVTKTQCYHYFHNNCLVRYLKYAKKNEEKAVCPVCRESLDNLGNLSDEDELTEVLADFVVDPALRDWQNKMAAMKSEQARKGGIIDVVANSNKFLLDISSTPTVPMFSVLTEPSESKAENEKKDKEDSSSRKVKGHTEVKSDSGKPGRVRRTGSKENQHRPHSADYRRDKKTGSKYSGENRACSSGSVRGRYKQHGDRSGDNQRKARPIWHGRQKFEERSSKSASDDSNKSDTGLVPQRKTSAERDAERVVKEEDVAEIIVHGEKDGGVASDIRNVAKETGKKGGVESDKKIGEEKVEVGEGDLSSRVKGEITSEEQEEQKRTKQLGYSHERKERDRNNSRRGHGGRGRGYGSRSRGGNHGNPSRNSSGNTSRKYYRDSGLKEQNHREDDKSQTKDVLSKAEGQRSKESQEQGNRCKVESRGKPSINHSVEGISKSNSSKSESDGDHRDKMAPPGFHGSSKIKPPPGFEDFR